MQNRFPLRALLLASAVSLAAPMTLTVTAAQAETPADTLVIAHQIDDIISSIPGRASNSRVRTWCTAFTTGWWISIRWT